jgi:hypothetical protein
MQPKMGSDLTYGKWPTLIAWAHGMEWEFCPGKSFASIFRAEEMTSIIIPITTTAATRTIMIMMIRIRIIIMLCVCVLRISEYCIVVKLHLAGHMEI